MSALPHPSNIASNVHNVPVYDSHSKAPNKQSSQERRNKRKLATAVAQTSVKLSETKSIDLDRQLFNLTIQTRRDKSRLHCLLHDNSKLTKQAAILRSEIALMHSHLDGLKPRSTPSPSLPLPLSKLPRLATPVLFTGIAQRTASNASFLA